MKLIAVALTTSTAVALTAMAAPQTGKAAAGQVAFGQCAACHSLVPGQNGIGPSLAGAMGRKIASYPGYVYSPALQAGRGKVWSAALLNVYLANPNAMFPGNKMGIVVRDPKTRANIVAYLAKAKANK